ncbi:hypothetical protein CTI12_AA386530 [Artemisia annua]|uniref:Uncharacterized protein n=1 Tax=Artemisia annua TaxID=35608 RepID=A0A2U1MFB8_ARTAN|nr:hypothetical protein CTI12_AA386530 [Artemisia annua]
MSSPNQPDVVTISSDSSADSSDESLGWSAYFPPLPHGPTVDPNGDSKVQKGNKSSKVKSGKKIQKPPGPVAVLGLANEKTWNAILNKDFGVKKPSGCVADTKGKGKKH